MLVLQSIGQYGGIEGEIKDEVHYCCMHNYAWYNLSSYVINFVHCCAYYIRHGK